FPSRPCARRRAPDNSKACSAPARRRHSTPSCGTSAGVVDQKHDADRSRWSCLHSYPTRSADGELLRVECLAPLVGRGKALAGEDLPEKRAHVEAKRSSR